MKYIPDYRKFVNERINLEAYWTWNPKSQLYDKVNESAMSELDLLAKEAKDFKSFVKEFKKEFKNMDAGSPKELEAWLQTIYDSVKETMDESAVTEGKTSAAYIDPKTGKGYDLQYVSSKKRWELDIMKKGASIYSSAITTIKRDTLKEIQDWLDGYKIDSKWTQGLSESVNEAAKEVVLSNEILDFLEERGILKGSDAQKVHKDLTAFLKEKGVKESVDTQLTEKFKVKGSLDMQELQDRLVEIKFEKFGIGYSWTDKFGKEKYEEGSFADAKSFDEILKRISEEILYQEENKK